MTGTDEWTPVTGEDPNLTEGGDGLIDVRSTSADVGSDGRPYTEW
jgi:hypothetical protein